jgi:glycosyltransferase involved in cell wall biosynthesis
MTSDSPAVSVIVPCYQVTEFIAETLNSLRAQTFRDFETIIIADECPDAVELERALVPYRDEIVYIKQKDRGLPAARNAGIAVSRGRIIALLDGDDIWEPNYLEVQVGYLEKHPDVDAVYGNAVFFGDAFDGRTFRDVFPSRGEVTFSSLVSGQCRVHVSVTARLQAILNAGMFDASLRGGEDWDLWMRMIKTGSKFAYHDQVLHRHRVRRGSLSADKVTLPEAAITILTKVLARQDLTDQERRLAEESLRNYQALLDSVLGKIALYRGNRDEAILHLTKANRVMKERRLQAALLLLKTAPWLLYRLIHSRYATEYDFLH